MSGRSRPDDAIGGDVNYAGACLWGNLPGEVRTQGGGLPIPPAVINGGGGTDGGGARSKIRVC